jgi:glycosyltransferase involved in cell wall biosynthesis
MGGMQTLEDVNGSAWIETENRNVRIGYFTNAYPAVSHTFIRREIKAIEALGVTVFRYALRPGKNLIDPEDKAEEKQTHYIVKAGAVEMVRCSTRFALSRPLLMVRAIRQAFKMGWRSDRGILRHLIYVAEATVLADWCRRHAIQHVHAHFGTNPAAIAMFAHQLSGIPYSFTAHGSEEFEKALLLSLETKVKHASFVVCVSSFGRGQLMRWTSPDLWPKIAVIRCGLDAKHFDGCVRPPPPTPHFVCVGRLDEHKAQIVLVGAARRLRDAGIHCEIVLVGDGDMRPDVENAIRRAGLEREITITGWASGERVKAEIAAARALILPSVSENMPVVIMEAFALGRAVISTYVAGIPELVQPGLSGWLVPASDEIALSQAMREALEASVEQLAAMGAAGRLRVIERHDVLTEAAKLKSLFEAGLA